MFTQISVPRTLTGSNGPEAKPLLAAQPPQRCRGEDWPVARAQEQPVEGGEYAAIDTNRDGEPERFVATGPSVGSTAATPRATTASGGGQDPNDATGRNTPNRNEGTTGYKGEVLSDSRWIIRRVGRVLEVENHDGKIQVKEIGHTRIYSEIVLDGRKVFHRGAMRVGPGVPTKPRDPRDCLRLRGSFRNCPGVSNTMVEATRYYSGNYRGLCYGLRNRGFGPCAKAQVVERHSATYGGQFRWRMKWYALVQYKGGVQYVDWDRTVPVIGQKFYSARYVCDSGEDGQCIYGRR